MVSCNTKKPDEIWPYGVKYEIFVLSFADGNADGKGDLKGVTSKLDYLKELGVNGIWLMPIMPSPSYHKYDVTDNKGIHPDYGTVDDFRELINEAHKRGIKVIIDMVLNHTSDSHPWFQSAMASEDSPYRDYYVWNDLESVRNDILKKDTTLDSDNITQWHAVNNDTTADHYYGFFSRRMPDLNFDNQKVRDEFVDIARFWLKELNVDGFRFDAARHIYPEDRSWANHQFWNWYRTELQKIKPDVYLVGEVYSSEVQEVSYYTKGLPSLFNFKMGSAIINTINSGSDSGIVNEYQRMMDSYKLVSPEFLDAPILTNHDQNRVLSEFNGDKQKARVAASILLTLPGAPFIYYGEELGMLGMKPDENIREPFLWGDEKIETRWIDPQYSTKSAVASLIEQRKEDESLFNHYKRSIEYRNASKILTFGEIQPINRLPNEVVGMIRTYKGKSLVVFHNVSYREVSFTLEDDLLFYNKVDFTAGERVTMERFIITLPGYTSVVLRQE